MHRSDPGGELGPRPGCRQPGPDTAPVPITVAIMVRSGLEGSCRAGDVLARRPTPRLTSVSPGSWEEPE
jgi:hypothetical protein